MELKYLKMEKVYKYDLDNISKEEYDFLRNEGLQRIQRDDRALIEYAVVSILCEKIANLDNNVKKLETEKKTIKSKKRTQKKKEH